jgi:sec-independent protein translocase protein TatA
MRPSLSEHCKDGQIPIAPTNQVRAGREALRPGEKYMGELLTLLFGGKKLPELGKGLGEGLRGFKDGIKALTDDVNHPEKATQTIAPKPNESL